MSSTLFTKLGSSDDPVIFFFFVISQMFDAVITQIMLFGFLKL